MSTALRLYQATDDLLEVRVWLDEHAPEIIAAGGDLDALPELRDLIELAEGSFDVKAERVALFIRELLATSNARKEESKRLGALATTDEKAADGLKRYLCREMQRAGRPKIDGKLVKLAVQRNSAPAAMLDEVKALAWIEHEESDGPHHDAWAPPIGFGDEYDAARELVTVKQVTTVTLNKPAVIARWQQRYEETRSRMLNDVEVMSCNSEDSLDREAQRIANEDALFVQLGIRVEHGSHIRIR